MGKHVSRFGILGKFGVLGILGILGVLGVLGLILAGCAGLKVVNPNDENKESGTKMLDFSDGSPKLVSTFSCQLESMGKKFSAIGKTEQDARAEVLARCHDRTVISFCKEDKITCRKN